MLVVYGSNMRRGCLKRASVILLVVVVVLVVVGFTLVNLTKLLLVESTRERKAGIK